MINVCSFFGHKEIQITEEISVNLFKIIENLIKQGCYNFYFGGLGMFDDLCYKIVSELKKTYTNIKRFFCVWDYRHLKKQKRPNWLKNEEYEEFILLDFKIDLWYLRIYYRNRAIIDNSDIVLFYVKNNEKSGAYKAYKYAKQKKKNILNMYEK